MRIPVPLVRPSAFAGLIIAGALALTLTSVSPASAIEEDQIPDSLVSQIAKIAEDGVDSVETLSSNVGLPSDGPGSLLGAAGGLTATVIFESAPTEEQLAQVAAIASVERVFTVAPAVSVVVEPSRLAEIESLAAVVSVEPVLEPKTGSATSTKLHATLGAVPAKTEPKTEAQAVQACRESIPVEADGPLHSAEARSEFAVDGTGLTVGIISDSFAAISVPTSPAIDVQRGLLSGPGNPCGYELPVDVLSDYAGADEGRGMAQLVHGIAPGAKLLVATGFLGEISMVQAIADLADAGADIIVDDLGYSTELVFQHGMISSMITEVRATGVAYYSAAGNDTVIGAPGSRSAGLPISGWMTPQFRATPCPLGVEPEAEFTTFDCLDWSPIGAGEPTDNFGFNASGDLGLTLKWGEPKYGVNSSFEAQIYRVDGSPRTLVSTGESIDETYPMQHIRLLEDEAPGEYEFVVIRDTSTQALTPAISLMTFNSGAPMVWRQHDRSAGPDVVGSTVLGHAGNGSAVSVAAAPWSEPSLPETFTSFGPSLLLFEPSPIGASAPAAALSAPKWVSAPDIASVDGTQTSFFGQPDIVDGNTQYRFYGTSAAAPNMAAVHALAAQYAPKATADEILAAALSTTRPMTNPYASSTQDAYVFGAGLVDARALLASLTPDDTDGGEGEGGGEGGGEITPGGGGVKPDGSNVSPAADGTTKNATLANTGQESSLLIVLAVGTLLAGAALTLRRRQRV